MSHKNEKTQHFEKAEDIRTKVLDSMIYRLDERANMVITEVSFSLIFFEIENYY